MTTDRAQHASLLTPCAPVRGGRAHAAAVLAVWAASWIFLALAVAAPAGRMHAESVRGDRVVHTGQGGVALARAVTASR